MALETLPALNMSFRLRAHALIAVATHALCHGRGALMHLIVRNRIGFSFPAPQHQHQHYSSHDTKKQHVPFAGFPGTFLLIGHSISLLLQIFHGLPSMQHKSNTYPSAIAVPPAISKQPNFPFQDQAIAAKMKGASTRAFNFLFTTTTARLSLTLHTDANNEVLSRGYHMNVDQHLKVAQWHIEQARLHATSQHTCGCPVNEHYQRIIDEIEAGKVEEELVCSTEK
ncbi:hypothetical protein [Mariprofundus ferrinatatus]|nr:hypothetical protein [Mariprofundus ferrinatatus]